MIEIEKPKIETVALSEDGAYGRFIIEPLERGYGTTLGNSLTSYLTVLFTGGSSNLCPNRWRFARIFNNSWRA